MVGLSNGGVGWVFGSSAIEQIEELLTVESVVDLLG